MRPVKRLAGACLLLLAASGCQKIADIQEARFVAAGDGGADGGGGDVSHPSEEQCATYCGAVEAACTGESEISAYPAAGYCTALCPKMALAEDPGDDDQGNSYECRLKHAKLAEQLMGVPSEIASYCRAASPGGDGTCGTDCESYCQLYAATCSEPAPDPDCLDNCLGLRSDDSLDSEASFAGLDTIQCRLAHISAAAADPAKHCPHATLRPANGTPCLKIEPNCDDYCGMLMNTCRAPGVQQYETASDCLATCRKFEPGMAPDFVEDTLACRRYHTYNSLGKSAAAQDHCDHAGPGGDGHCSKICPAYCKLVQSVCPEEFATVFPGGSQECRDKCGSEVLGKTDEKDQLDFGYSVAEGKAGGDTIQCRLYYTTKAASNRTQCASALGNGECR